MSRSRARYLTRRVLPVAVIAIVLVLVAVSFETTLQTPKQSFDFGVYWPTPSQYVSDHPLPNVYLSINYTGLDARNYTYSISYGSTVLTQAEVLVGPSSPFRVLAYAPVPAVLQAQIFEQGRLVFRQNLTLS